MQAEMFVFLEVPFNVSMMFMRMTRSELEQADNSPELSILAPTFLGDSLHLGSASFCSLVEFFSHEQASSVLLLFKHRPGRRLVLLSRPHFCLASGRHCGLGLSGGQDGNICLTAAYMVESSRYR
jgi:hypothetical protein